MKSEYITKKEHEKDCLVVFFVGFLVMAFFVNVISIEASTKDKQVRSILAEQYNFTENECIAWQKIDIDVRCAGRRCWEPIECSQYCNTKQVQNGEECKTEEQIHTEFNPCNWNELTQDQLEYYLKYPGLGCVDVKEYKINITNCTPVYNNITYNCQDGDMVRKVREASG